MGMTPLTATEQRLLLET